TDRGAEVPEGGTVEAIERARAVRREPYQSGIDQHPQVLRHGGLGKLQTPDDVLAAAAVELGKAAQDLQPRRMRQCGKPLRKGRWRVRFARTVHRSSAIYDERVGCNGRRRE